MTQERRRGVRSSIRLIAIVKNLATGRVHRWLTKNISEIGLCLVTDEAIERGTRLEVEFKLPDYPSPLTIIAEVVWVMMVGAPRKSYEEPRIELGVKFVELAPKMQALLRQYATMTAPPPDQPSPTPPHA